MRRTLTILAILVASTLTACGSEPDERTDQPAAGQPDALAATGIPPVPDQATADAYIAALDAIDPMIDRDDPESAIDRGRNHCSTIRDAPDDRARQIETTNQRFTARNSPEGRGPEIAEQILGVVHQHLCPAY
jgi:hypothetical protein